MKMKHADRERDYWYSSLLASTGNEDQSMKRGLLGFALMVHIWESLSERFVIPALCGISIAS